MILIACLFLLVCSSLAFCLGAIFGRAAGWEEGYEAASAPGEDIPAEGSPFVRTNPLRMHEHPAEIPHHFP